MVAHLRKPHCRPPDRLRSTMARVSTPGSQSGGNNTINLGPTRLPFDPAIGDQLVSKLPSGKTILLKSVGSGADQAIADQYQQYLQSKGFQVQRTAMGMLVPPPDHKISLGDPNAPEIVVIIAP